jgi:hypothetical protein
MVGEVMDYIDGKGGDDSALWGGKGVFVTISGVSGCYVIIDSDSLDSFRVIRRGMRQEG